MRIEDVWKANTFLTRSIRIALVPASWLYGIGWIAYQSLYDFGLKRAKRPHFPIICVGNYTVGGTGKTPVTLAIAKALIDAGSRVVIGCSGYGSPASERAQLTPSGPLAASKFGDEPALFRSALPDVPIVVGRDRVEAARLCQESYPASILLMDDGLQHLPLAKDISIVIASSSQNGFCLPAGPYRVPKRYRKRADFDLNPTYSPLVFVNSMGETIAEPEEAVVLCAIGNPEAFQADLAARGLRFGATKFLADHDPLDDPRLFDEFPPQLPIVVTEKDWVKLKNYMSDSRLVIAKREARLSDEFKAWLIARLELLEPPRT